MNNNGNIKSQNDLINYVYKQIALELGRKQLRQTHYLEKELLFDDYYEKHEKELQEMFPGTSWPMFY